jgi:hypothetical protein
MTFFINSLKKYDSKYSIIGTKLDELLDIVGPMYINLKDVVDNISKFSNKPIYVHYNDEFGITGFSIFHGSAYQNVLMPNFSKMLLFNPGCKIDTNVNVLFDKKDDNYLTIFGDVNNYYLHKGLKYNLVGARINDINNFFSMNKAFYLQILINGNNVGDFIFDFLLRNKFWEKKILEIENVITNMSNMDFEFLINKIEIG